MPPKKGYRKSMPARINSSTSSTLTPSRRSPRVPAPSKSTGESTQSNKSLDLTSATPPESSLNIRFYNPKTPPKTPSTNGKPRDASPNVPLTRRRTFQARPSRLSTVYTPVVGTPNTTQGSRRTRRTAALETPHNQLADQKFPESVGTTGWTLDQYMGGLDYDGTMAGQTSPTSASSKGTRTSARPRKPTVRAKESLESTQKPRKKKTNVPVPKQEEAPQVADTRPNKIVKTSKRAKNGKKNVPKKSILQRIETNEEKAGQKLYELVAVALGTDFVPPAGAEQLIANAREAHKQRQIDALQKTQADEEASAKGPEAVNKNAKDTKSRIILKFKKKTPPRIDVDGWARSGRVNDSGEEIVVTPTDHSPYRSPHNYGDEGLPYPPVRSRSDQQADDDNSLGFPPLIGDRNIPFDVQSQFETEDVTEEKAKAQARGEKRRQEQELTVVANEIPAPTEKKSRKKRRHPEPDTDAVEATASSAAPAPSSAPAPTEDEERKPKRRRRGERASMPTPTTATTPAPKAPTTKNAISKSAKAATKTTEPATAPVDDKNNKPLVQRIRLKLKLPPKEEEHSASSEVSSDEKPKKPGTKNNTKKQPASARGKKGAVDPAPDDEVPKKNASVKRKRGDADLDADDETLKNKPSKKIKIAAVKGKKGTVDLVSDDETEKKVGSVKRKKAAVDPASDDETQKKPAPVKGMKRVADSVTDDGQNTKPKASSKAPPKRAGGDSRGGTRGGRGQGQARGSGRGRGRG